MSRLQKKNAKNPVFRNEGLYEASSTPVTKGGVVSKTLLLLALVALTALMTASYLWDKMATEGADAPFLLAFVAIFLTLGVAILIAFKPHLAKPLSFVYAVLEGYLLGVISVAAVHFDGGSVVATALFITLSVVVATNLLYSLGIVKVNQKFVSIIFMMTVGALFFYLMVILGSLFGMDTSFMHDGSPLAIGISLVMLLLASLNLFVDYYMVDSFIEQQTDRSYEWYLAFGLTVTVVWIYIESLRLVQNLTGGD